MLKNEVEKLTGEPAFQWGAKFIWRTVEPNLFGDSGTPNLFGENDWHPGNSCRINSANQGPNKFGTPHWKTKLGLKLHNNNSSPGFLSGKRQFET
ncbi:MAG: hypothetical protein WA004_10965 [Saprospiraceae bacterium]